MGHAVDYFNPLSTEDANAVIKKCIQENIFCTLAVDLATALAAPESIQKKVVLNILFDNKLLVNKFYIVLKSSHDLENTVGSFNLKLGTRMFFFKSLISKDVKGFFIADNVQMFELKRRRHERYEIPADWSQSCSVFIENKKDFKLDAKIIDISLSGVRLFLKAQLPEFKTEQKISFVFQIHKRGEVMITGTIRFVKKDLNFCQTLGIEFQNLTPLLESKIQNTCEDLERNLKIKVRVT